MKKRKTVRQFLLLLQHSLWPTELLYLGAALTAQPTSCMPIKLAFNFNCCRHWRVNDSSSYPLHFFCSFDFLLLLFKLKIKNNNNKHLIQHSQRQSQLRETNIYVCMKRVARVLWACVYPVEWSKLPPVCWVRNT